MAEGNLFFIKSCMHGKVLDVAGGCGQPGTQVIVWDQKGSDFDNQLWYADAITNTIRSKDCHLCLEIGDGNTLVLNEFNGDDNQKWLAKDGRVCNAADEDRVLDIAAKSEDSGARVCAWQYHGDVNQTWDFEFQPPRFFLIRSKMNGKVLDIKGADAGDGADVITYDHSDDNPDNQVWYQDKCGFICSKLNNMVFDSSDGKIEMEPFEFGKVEQMWVPLIHENKIVNAKDPNLAIDIKAAKDKNGAKIICYEFGGGDNQLWDFEFLD